MQRLSLSEYRQWYEFYLANPFGPHIDNFYAAQMSFTMAKLMGRGKPKFEHFHPVVAPKKRQSVDEMRTAFHSIVNHYKANQVDG